MINDMLTIYHIKEFKFITYRIKQILTPILGIVKLFKN